MKAADGKSLLAMLLILLLAFAIGTVGLLANPIMSDEMYSLTNMGVFDPPYSMQQVLDSLTQNSPDQLPLYYWLGAAWARLAGWKQVALRYLSLMAGLLLLACLYRFGTEIFNRRVGLCAALLMASSAFAINYFYILRFYTLLMLLAALQGWLYWRLAHRRRAGPGLWLFFILSTALLLYTQSFALVWLAGLGLYHLVFVKKSRRWWQIISGWLLGAALFLPHLPIFIDGLRYAQARDLQVRLSSSALELIEAFIPLFFNGSLLLALFFSAMLAFLLWRRPNHALLKLLAMSGAMLLSILLINEVINLILLDRLRYFLLLWIPGTIILAYTITAVPHWKVIACIFLVAWGLAAAQFYGSPTLLSRVGGAARTRLYPQLQHYSYLLQDQARSGDFLLGFTQDDKVNTRWRFPYSVADYYVQALLSVEGYFIPPQLTGAELLEDLADLSRNQAYILLAYDPLALPSSLPAVLEFLKADFAACTELVEQERIYIQRYARRFMPCEKPYAPIHYDNGIKIIDKFADYDKEQKTVRVVTGWQVADEAQLQEYNVSLQILTPDWQMMAQSDRHLYDDVLKWYVAELSTDGLPPGDYRVVVILYDRYSRAKVSGTDLTSGEVGTILPILAFTVEK